MERLVTRGRDAPTMFARDAGRPTVCIFFRPVDVARLAGLVRTGAILTVTPTRRVAPSTLEARAKVTSNMNQILAELDADARGALSLMVNVDGFVTENSIANFFLVADARLFTAPDRNVLEGVTRKVVFELASRLGIEVVVRDLSAYDLAQAGEFFLTSERLRRAAGGADRPVCARRRRARSHHHFAHGCIRGRDRVRPALERGLIALHR